MVETGYEVFNAVTDPFGNNLGRTLIDIIFDRRDIHALGIVGEPGMAKTTFLAQLVNKIRTDYPQKPRLHVIFLSFDHYVQHIENRFKTENRSRWNRSNWEDEELDEFSDGLYELANDMIEKAAQFEVQSELRSIFLMDLVAKGKRNRGKTTLKRLARRKDFFTLGLEADPRVQYRAEKIRRLVRLADGDFKKIKQAFEAEKVVSDIFDDPVQLEAVSMRMGSPNMIRAIRQEVDLMAIDWARTELDDLSKINQVVKYLPASASSLTDPEKFMFQLRLAYTDHFLTVEMGIPLNRVMIGLVEYLESPIHWYQRPLEGMEGMME